MMLPAAIQPQATCHPVCSRLPSGKAKNPATAVTAMTK
jgi:hypothetical protein